MVWTPMTASDAAMAGDEKCVWESNQCRNAYAAAPAGEACQAESGAVEGCAGAEGRESAEKRDVAGGAAAEGVGMRLQAPTRSGAVDEGSTAVNTRWVGVGAVTARLSSA
jgi:hypothetical protein